VAVDQWSRMCMSASCVASQAACSIFFPLSKAVLLQFFPPNAGGVRERRPRPPPHRRRNRAAAHAAAAQPPAATTAVTAAASRAQAPAHGPVSAKQPTSHGKHPGRVGRVLLAEATGSALSDRDLRALALLWQQLPASMQRQQQQAIMQQQVVAAAAAVHWGGPPPCRR